MQRAAYFFEGNEQKHQPYQSWMGVDGSRWVEIPACLVHLTSGMGTFFPLRLQITSAAKKPRQVVRVDWSWMDIPSSLSMLLPLPPFFSALQSPEASISLITESLHLNGRLCIVRTKGRAASEEVRDRGMDWAQRLGWVELQVQASLPERRQLKEGLQLLLRTGKTGGRSARSASGLTANVQEFDDRISYWAVKLKPQSHPHFRLCQTTTAQSV